MASSCAALRAAPAAQITTMATYATMYVWRRAPSPAASSSYSAPIAVHTSNEGNGRISTASNIPATTAAASVARSAAASRASLGSGAPTMRRSAETAMAITMAIQRMAVTKPRSDTIAIQSLLGHGLNVIPGTDGFIDGSLRGTNRG